MIAKTASIMLLYIVSAAAGNPECDSLTATAKWALFAEQNRDAITYAVSSAACAPDDAASIEIATLGILFEMKRILGIDKDSAPEQLPVGTPEVEILSSQFMQLIAEGRRRTQETLAKDPNDINAMFLRAKINLNLVWFNLQILDKKSGLDEFEEAQELLQQVLAQNPDQCRALTASGWIHYKIGTLGFFQRLGLKMVGISGDADEGRRRIAKAATVSTCDPWDHDETLFSLMGVLIREKKWEDVVRYGTELQRKYPTNLGIAKGLAEAAAELEKHRK
ncbi:MAG: hypothetical protein Q8Q39_01090 [bacterium]|nr:hypothetical protein [bacterium]